MNNVIGILAVVLLGLGTGTVLAQNQNRNLVVGMTNTSQSVQKLALVIGNADYKSAPLKNPINDSRAMSAKLKELGFEVIEYENMQQKTMGKVLREFRARLQPGAVALFFYAGHGLQVKGVNYLPAVDAEIDSEDDIPHQSLDVNKIFDVMADARTRLNLVFLDACRNNPYVRSTRSTDGGLAKVPVPSGTLISFATRPGSVAQDGDGTNGLYTKNLIAAMDVPNLPVEQMIKRVVTGVKQHSRGAQEPWIEGSIEGDFYFRGGAQEEANVDQAFWEAIKDSSSVAAYDAYLTKYPQGAYAVPAKEAKMKLEKEAEISALRRQEEMRRDLEAKRKTTEEMERLRTEQLTKQRQAEVEMNRLNEEKQIMLRREQNARDELERQKSQYKKTIVVPMTF